MLDDQHARPFARPTTEGARLSADDVRLFGRALGGLSQHLFAVAPAGRLTRLPALGSHPETLTLPRERAENDRTPWLREKAKELADASEEKARRG